MDLVIKIDNIVIIPENQPALKKRFPRYLRLSLILMYLIIIAIVVLSIISLSLTTIIDSYAWYCSLCNTIVLIINLITQLCLRKVHNKEKYKDCIVAASAVFILPLFGWTLIEILKLKPQFEATNLGLLQISLVLQIFAHLTSLWGLL